jgi:glycosyltransferase involved in cell wall biosynthesis
MFIPNAIPIKEYDFYERKKVNPKILWVRAFDKTYNPLLAIKLLNILKKKYSKVELCMVGPAKDETINEVKLLINQNNLSENCIITGVLEKEEWHKLSKSYDVFINTTNIDNMPVSIIEAMALGIPIVSTNVGGIPYLISNNKTGITVPINDEQKMATEIIKLIENPNEANRISKNARSFVEQFDLEIIKNDWIHLLK